MGEPFPSGEMEVVLEAPRRKGGRLPAFFLAERRIPVTAVLDRWPGADHLYLKVRAVCGARYILRRDDHSMCWTLHSFEQGPERAG